MANIGASPDKSSGLWWDGIVGVFQKTHQLKSVNLLVLWVLLLAVFCIMFGFKPTELPAPGFDEGWTLSVAKNWAEFGVFALRLEDRWVAPDVMVQPFTVTLPVGISLRLWGIGVLQARLPGILFTLGTLILLYLLAERLFNTRVAWGALFVVLLLAPVPDFQPILFGRQALGEMPMLCLLLAGYYFWLRSLEKPGKYMILAVVFWGLGVITKRQVLPFWILSWIVPVLVALALRQWRILRITVVTGVLAGIAAMGFSYLDSSLYRNWPLYGPSVLRDEYALFAAVWHRGVRNHALFEVAWYGGSSLVGLLYAILSVCQKFAVPRNIENSSWGALSLVMLVLSWTTWFALGSLGWLRSFAPIFVIGAMFFAKLIHDCSSGYSVRYIVKKLTPGLSWNPEPRFEKPRIQSLVAIILVIGSLLTGFVNWVTRFPLSSNQLYLVADYINNHTPRNTKIETIDSELFFLVDRRFHYPPDTVFMITIYRTFLDQDISLKGENVLMVPFYALFPDPNKQVISIAYDDYQPLEADPDYIVVGPFGDLAELYDALLDSDEFSLVKAYPSYLIYERVR